MSGTDGTKLSDWQLRLQGEARALLARYGKAPGAVGLSESECLDAITPLAIELQAAAEPTDDDVDGGIHPTE